MDEISGKTAAYTGLEIAVVGMAGRFAQARNLGEFWDNLRQGVESVSFFSDDELDEKPGPELASNPNFVRARAMLEDASLFDAEFFGYSPREAQIIDPQQRVFLECAWEALEEAGFDPARPPGPVGVFGGVGVNTYYFQSLVRNPELLRALGDIQVGIANDKDYLANRVSYKLNLEGPALVVQSACSTSLVAVHLACQSLLAGECDLALAGGVSVSFPQKRGYLFHPNGINSPDGHCRAFDAQAKGTVSGEGAALVVLRRLEDALEERDAIRAVIKGSAVNNDGALKAGFTAPRIKGQANVIRAAQQVSDVDPSTVQYIEAHGSGTELGDPIEIAALTEAFQAGGATGRGFCALGSVKTNIGHTDSAAGVAGLIKTVLALQHRQIPASLHFEAPNPRMKLEESPFFICAELRDWKAEGGRPRRAGISSFGLGGTNAHVIVEEAPPSPQPSPSRPWQLLLLSARSREALDESTARLAAHLQRHPDQPLADVAYTLQTGRQAFGQRRALVCRGREEAAQILESRDASRLLSRRCPDSADAPVVFLFPGLGEQYPGMGRELYLQEEVFRQELDRCADLLQPLLGLDLREALFPPQDEAEEQSGAEFDLRRMVRGQTRRPDEGSRRLDETWLVQPALFAVEYALARQWMSWGVRPQAMLGYSLGEYVAACLSGVFSLEDALRLTARRAQLIQQLPEGAMLAVPLPEGELKGLLSGELSISAVNGPALGVVAGPPQAVSELEQSLQERGLACRRLKASHAFHSRMMRPLGEAVSKLMASVRLNPPQIPYLSNLTGGWVQASEATDPDYWVQHLCQPVRFAEGISELWRMEGRLMLEVGPGQSLTSLALQHPESAKVPGRVVLPSMRHQYDRQSDQAVLLSSLGQLWMAGAEVDWKAFWGREERCRVPLPTYPFQRKLFWVEPSAQAVQSSQAWGEASGQEERLPSMSDWFHAPTWKRSVQPAVPIAEDGQQRLWLLFQQEWELRDELVRRLEKAGQRVVLVEPAAGEEFRHFDDRYLIDPTRPEHFDALLEALGAIPERILHLWTLGGEVFSLDRETLQERQAEGFTALLLLVQALGKRPLPESLQLTLVTNGLAELEQYDEIDPAKALMLGPMRVIPYEYPQIRCLTIDLAPDDPTDRMADRILGELGRAGNDELVAWRGERRWLPAYEAVPLPEPVGADCFRQNGCYLITGGLGGIGLALAEHLARKVQARLVLTGRTGLPERSQWAQLLESGDPQKRAIEKVQAIEALGAEVLIGRADVCDQAAMKEVLEEARQRFGRLDGVIHAAGLPGQGLMQLKAVEQAAQVLAPKVEGTRVLARLLEGDKPAFLALFSSMTALSGGIGELDYTAANAFLDAFAHWHSKESGIPTVSIDWCAWQWDAWMDQGMAGFRPEVRSYLEEQRAAFGLTFDEGAQALERILSAGLPQLIVSTRRLEGRLERRQTVADVLEQLEEARRSEGQHARPELATEYLAPRNPSESRIAAIWEELLGIDRAGVHDDFFQLGGHSLLGTRLMARIYESFGVTLPLRALFESPTVAGLSEAVAAGKNGTEGDRPLQAAIPPRKRGKARQLLQNLDRMSDQEVDALLARKAPGREKRP
ncbi:MAG: SDR family NAD(P)-dependent oxidoreductase [Acidobacteriota bacterium]